MKKYNLSFFLISNSPWPISISLAMIFMMLNLIMSLNEKINIFLLLNFLLVMMLLFFWWNDVIMESTYKGFHNNYIMIMTIYSMILFIISEIFFFISFFWSFFHSMFSPDIMVGSNWPYLGISSINYISLPLMNSLLLISSGCSITWCHYCMLSKKNNISKLSLFLTIILGLIFIILQMLEYKFMFFSFSDGIMGSIFFLSTGFHGFHVMIGILFMTMMFIRMNNIHFCNNHIMGLEFSIWYWHFVDVIWIYLYMMVYWLGS